MISTTIHGLLTAGAGAGAATALSAPTADSLSYHELRQLLETTRSALHAHGIGPADRIALVLENGPQMAAAFLAIAASATAAPLNPSYKAEELHFYLADVKARMLIVADTGDSPAVAAAQQLGIPVVRLLTASARAAGSFTLEFPTEMPAAAPLARHLPAPEDIAIILHTSGTTSRPKIVPLTNRNVAASAANVRSSLWLGAADRGLNIMPLFHIHGLIAGLLAPLSAGGEVCCTPGFNALKFFPWMAQARPTWYTAVPTMHQAIVARAPRNEAIIAANPLRFIRSSSASLPPQVIRELERAFSAPVIESYGMTEAAHQMTSNPLPPGTRKSGSVGVPAGPEVIVINAHGEPAAVGTPGEIVIRGANVMREYESNPIANRESFIRGWFRTGDQGTFDAEGYLTITGRLKEIINRGGEKISPREVDEILLDHPAVSQCVTFAIPHPKLGEEVAAAVTLRETLSVTEGELREFVATRVAAYKVPRTILILAEIPRGPTGKLQRIGLAQKLGLV